MNELFPIVGGILLGALLLLLPPKLRVFTAIVGVVVIGGLATVVSGESQISWAFLAIDILGTAIAAACSYVLLPRFSDRVRRVSN